MKIYLAGAMRGVPRFNFPAFHAVATRLRAQGHEVFSPAEKDNERHGTDISAGNATGDESIAAAEHGFNLREALGDESIAAAEHGFNLREALGVDLAWICAHADAIALLPGWQVSKGATAERAAAVALGLEIIEL